MDAIVFDDYEPARPLAFDWGASEDEYRADPRVNFHTLAKFHRDPRAFANGYFDKDEPNDAMTFGSAFHCKLLKPHEYGDKFAVFAPPVNPKTDAPFGVTTNAYKEAFAAFLRENEGKTVISQGSAELIDTLIAEARFHPLASKLLASGDGVFEQSICGEIDLETVKVAVKGRVDAYTEAGLIDIKTTANLDDGSGRDRFRFTVYDYKYLVQLAFYHMILTRCYNAPFVPAWLIVLEKNPPNRCAVYAPTREVLVKAYGVVFSWLREFQVSQQSKRFRSRYDDLQLITSYDPEKDII